MVKIFPSFGKSFFSNNINAVVKTGCVCTGKICLTFFGELLKNRLYLIKVLFFSPKFFSYNCNS